MPRRHKRVTITPAMNTPKVMERKASLNFSPKRKAAIEPVQAPVPGKGIAIKSASPIHPYLSTIFLPPVRSKTQFKILSKCLIRKRSRKRRRKGTGRRLPKKQTKKAICPGIWWTHRATGNPP